MARRHRPMASINMVPLIDVMLVLLIIFMITAPMVHTGDIDLPSVGETLSPSTAPIEVDIDAGGGLSVRDRAGAGAAQRVTQAQLVALIQQKQSSADQAVVIAADRSTRYDAVVKVMDALQSNGIRHIGLLAKDKGN